MKVSLEEIFNCLDQNHIRYLISHQEELASSGVILSDIDCFVDRNPYCVVQTLLECKEHNFEALMLWPSSRFDLTVYLVRELSSPVHIEFSSDLNGKSRYGFRTTDSLNWRVAGETFWKLPTITEFCYEIVKGWVKNDTHRVVEFVKKLKYLDQVVDERLPISLRSRKIILSAVSGKLPKRRRNRLWIRERFSKRFLLRILRPEGYKMNCCKTKESSIEINLGCNSIFKLRKSRWVIGRVVHLPLRPVINLYCEGGQNQKTKTHYIQEEDYRLLTKRNFERVRQRCNSPRH